MLQALMKYGNELDSEPGFRTREVRWCVELAADGRFLNVLPLGDGKRGTMHSRCPDMHGMNSGGKSHFLVETAQTVVLLFKASEEQKKIEGTQDKHRFFVDMLRLASGSAPDLAAIANALKDESRLVEIRDSLTKNKAKHTDWLAWRVAGSDPREDKAVQEWWRSWRRADIGGDATTDSISSPDNAGDGAMTCFLTGEEVQPLPTHRPIKGLPGPDGKPNSFGDPLVCFDKPAYRSFGLVKSANAAMSAEAAQKYVDGLNDLIRNHSRKLANALVVHWFKEQVAPQDDPLEWLNGFESQEQTEAAAQGAARRLLESIRKGERVDLGNNHYYALTLSGASGRVMVRDWMEGRFEDLVRNVEAWFADFAIVIAGDRKDCDGKKIAHDPKFYRVCLALVRNDQKKSISENLKQLPAPNAATLWKVAVQNLLIPQPLMAQALARFRADLVDKDSPPLNHARMGLIKAYFIRLQQGGVNTMKAYLNPDHPEPAYHCGRLLAVLAELQYAALGDVGAGVIQRYYAAASQMPGLILGRLVRNAQFHLNKPDKPWLKSEFEEPMMEIGCKLKDSFPQILNLEGQGLFALGYYQQLATLRAGKKTNETGQGENQ